MADGSEEDSPVDVKGGTRGSILAVILSSLYLVVSLVISLTLRLYLKGFYYTAHISGISVVLAFFVVTHHKLPVRQWLGLGTRTFSLVQCLLNVWYMCCPLAAAGAFAALITKAINMNYDYTASLVWACASGILMFYLFLMSCKATQRHRYDCYKLQQLSHNRNTKTLVVSIEETSLPENETNNTTTWKPGHSPQTSSNRSRCARGCAHGCFWIFYVIFHVFFMVSVFLTAYEPWRVLDDVIKYRDDKHMHIVSVPGHRSLALFLKCTGSGNDTILFENGLGGTFHMGWHFVPRILSDRFQVCSYDRRGYGWSESLESDYVNAYLKEPQWTDNNVEYLKVLIDTAKVPKPFYYVGHSYGGHHITLMAAKYPELIKGLVFLDGAKFSPVATLRNLVELAANFQPFGLLRIAIQTKIIDYHRLFGSVVEFEALPAEMESTLLATFYSGLFFAANMRENGPLLWSNLARDSLNEILTDELIEKPVLVIDAGTRNSSSWFPDQYFPLYRSDLHFVVENSTHESLVYSVKYAKQTSQLIENFIDMQHMGNMQ